MAKVFKIILRIFAVLLIGVSFLAFFSAKWYIEIYGDIGFESILFTLFAGLEGVASDLMTQWIKSALIPALCLTALLSLAILFSSKWGLYIKLRKSGKRLRLYPLYGLIKPVLCIALCASVLWASATTVRFQDYLEHIMTQTQLYNEEYVSPDDVDITFPKTKRNLIYIFLESMETTFLSKAEGGKQEETVIPELFKLAKNNINFSHNDGVGGWPVTSQTTWTVAAMVAQTSGVPLSIPVGGNHYGDYNRFLPGLTTLSDILHNAGYKQAVMFGSDKEFAGRDKYFLNHNTDKVYDYATALEDKIIPEGYRVWWGFEDRRLFPYAKQVITEMAAQDEPFAFTLLTVDTHHIGGYVCDICGSKYEEQYENVYACSSKQVAAFVEWIQKQPFYENTTVVLCGDHLSMDSGYFNRKGIRNVDRRVYNCFINSAVTTEHSKNREFSTMDIFPTVLAAMGCNIEGNRLGLGVNLFSDLPTLAEQHGGIAWLNNEIKKGSVYYINHFTKPK